VVLQIRGSQLDLMTTGTSLQTSCTHTILTLLVPDPIQTVLAALHRRAPPGCEMRHIRRFRRGEVLTFRSLCRYPAEKEDLAADLRVLALGVWADGDLACLAPLVAWADLDVGSLDCECGGAEQWSWR
jgi:hypothetical protein